MEKSVWAFVLSMSVVTALVMAGLLVTYISGAQPDFRGQIVAVVLAFLAWCLVFGFLQIAKHADKRFWYTLEHPFYSFAAKLLLILIITAGVALLIVVLGKDKAEVIVSPLAILFTGVLATIGWNYTSFETRRAEIRKFTVDTINKLVDDASFVRLQSEFWRGLKHCNDAGQFATYQSLHKEADYPACIAFFTMGKSTESASENFDTLKRVYAYGRFMDQLEWLALLIRQRRIDGQLAREMLSDTIILAATHMAVFIREARQSDTAHYEHVVWLYEHWTGRRSSLHPMVELGGSHDEKPPETMQTRPSPAP